MTNPLSKRRAAIIGSGNIGTDLLIKLLRTSQHLEPVLMVGIDKDSEGLQRAARLGVPTTAEGIDGLLAHAACDTVDVIFDATSARAHASPSNPSSAGPRHSDTASLSNPTASRAVRVLRHDSQKLAATILTLRSTKRVAK